MPDDKIVTNSSCPTCRGTGILHPRNSIIRSELAAILTHPCQQCAEDPEAWHTRQAFCQHRKADDA